MVCAALITAGGTGLRMGADRPKQYLEVLGAPILARTLAVYDNHPLISYIVITVPESDEFYCRTEIVEKFGLKKVRSIVSGGITRQASVYNGLQLCEDSEIVAIHDGVRPFVSKSVISSSVRLAKEFGACLTALPVKETVKRQMDKSLETIPRDGLWLARTPQVFKTSLIVKAHQYAIDHALEVTDDTALIERLGKEVKIVEDTFFNIKITTKEDMAIAEWIAHMPEFSLKHATINGSESIS